MREFFFKFLFGIYWNFLGCKKIPSKTNSTYFPFLAIPVPMGILFHILLNFLANQKISGNPTYFIQYGHSCLFGKFHNLWELILGNGSHHPLLIQPMVYRLGTRENFICFYRELLQL